MNNFTFAAALLQISWAALFVTPQALTILRQRKADNASVIGGAAGVAMGATWCLASSPFSGASVSAITLAVFLANLASLAAMSLLFFGIVRARQQVKRSK
jgi:hypothetical protein